MYDKKLMKLIKLDKIGEFMAKGEPVFMVKQDGSLVPITDKIKMEALFFHSIFGGGFAVYRKNHDSNGACGKTFKLGRWTFTVKREQKGDDEDVFDAR